MELTEDKTIENYGKKVVIVMEIQYYHTNLNGLVFHVDST